MRIILDINRYSDMARGDANVIATLESAQENLLPFVVLAELQAGFVSGTRLKENELFLELFLRRQGVTALFADHGTIRAYAVIQSQLRRQGTPIPINDIWLAALALQHHLHVFARDRHFDHLPQLLRV